MTSPEERLFQFKVMHTLEIINVLIAVVSMGVWGSNFFISSPLPLYFNYIPLLCAASTLIFFCCIGQYSKPDYISGKAGFPSRKKMVLFIVNCIFVYVLFFSIGLAIKHS